jgi:E3 ubiquitin-protein ligase DOA10
MQRIYIQNNMRPNSIDSDKEDFDVDPLSNLELSVVSTVEIDVVVKLRVEDLGPFVGAKVGSGVLVGVSLGACCVVGFPDACVVVDLPLSVVVVIAYVLLSDVLVLNFLHLDFLHLDFLMVGLAEEDEITVVGVNELLQEDDPFLDEP